MTSYHYSQQAEDYNKIENAIDFIEQNFRSQPTLEQISQSVFLSKYHFNRLFKRWAGVSPIQFMQFMTLDYTKKMLAQSHNILDTSLDAGLSGPGRLHDLFVTFDAMTPGEFKNQGMGLEISYGVSNSPFGKCLVATTKRGICHLGFIKEGFHQEALNQLFECWPGARFSENPSVVEPVVNRIFEPVIDNSQRPFHLLVKGTNFQINVWKALLTIPEGHMVSYQGIARWIGRPKAFRAVANAVAINPVAYLIPCHRVITQSGKIHRYRWGSTRKKAILCWEAAKSA